MAELAGEKVREDVNSEYKRLQKLRGLISQLVYLQSCVEEVERKPYTQSQNVKEKSDIISKRENQALNEKAIRNIKKQLVVYKPQEVIDTIMSLRKLETSSVTVVSEIPVNYNPYFDAIDSLIREYEQKGEK